MKSDIASDEHFIDDFIERVRASLHSCTGGALFSSGARSSSVKPLPFRAFNAASPEAQSVLHEGNTPSSQSAFDAASLQASSISLGVAVSGGADSVSMFVSLAFIAREQNIALHVITVNHNIRDEKESEEDALYVRSLCADFSRKGFPVDYTCKTFLPGEVFAEAEKRRKGLEEAARHLRYKAFEEFAREKKTAFIALAHTEDDQLETLLMRFFEGGGSDGAGGIKKTRGMFIRPLLGISRREIERFLTLEHISWRVDATNGDTSYFRNKIRCRLVPVLDALIPGWKSAVLAGAKKAQDDDEALNVIADSFSWSESGKSVRMPRKNFSSASRALQRRLLYRAFNKIGIEVRVPYRFIERICNAAASFGVFSEEAAGICVEITCEWIFVKKAQKDATDTGFSAIIGKAGAYEMPFGLLCVEHKEDARGRCVRKNASVVCKGQAGESSVLCVSLPFCIRSRQAGDVVATASGAEKSVSDILSDWKVFPRDRERIPIVQELATVEQKIVCIWGSVFGMRDWIVNDIEV